MAMPGRRASRGSERGSDLLGIYLNDHFAGSTGGIELLRRLVSGHRGTPDGAVLARLEAEVNADRDALRTIMRDLGVRERRYKLVAAWAAEKAGRLKANGYLVRRSPLSSVVELEAMMLVYAGKRPCGVPCSSALETMRDSTPPSSRRWPSARSGRPPSSRSYG